MSDLQTKLGGGLNKIQGSFQQGKQKIQTVQEISQYKKEIQEFSEMRGDLILKLGEETYRKLRTGDLQDPQLHEYFHSIAALDRKLFTVQKALELLEQKSNSVICSNCGASIGADDKFCGSCGQKQEERITLSDQTNLAVCPACEEQIPADAKFCACCGSRLVL